MQPIKASFISTALNEEDNIGNFLSSIISSSVLPGEVVLVDAYSKDKTLEIMENFKKNYNDKLKVKIIRKKGNRSIGRNEAIKNSTGNIIVCSDAGCVLDKDFIKNILNPFTKKDVDVVSGFYKPVAKSVFQRCLSTYTSVQLDKIDPDNFLPSSRSVAFKKDVWERADGYPEHLNTCEDLIFDLRLKNIGAKFVFNKHALIYWPQRKNIGEAIVQFFSYAYGDGLAHYFRKQTPLLYIRYAVGVFLVSLGILFRSNFLVLFVTALFFLYLIWSILKNFKYVKKAEALVFLPVLQITSDVAVLCGTTLGSLRSLWATQKTR